MAEHTPLPWILSDDGLTIVADPEREDHDDCCIVADLESHSFCSVPDDQAEANAALIVRAVNSHADLLAALEALLGDVEGYGLAHPETGRFEPETASQARAAIAKAKGE